MRWLKHLSNAHNDEKVNRLRSEFGAAGYGMYWLVLERIAGQISSDNPRTILGDSAKGWGMFLGTRADHARKVLGRFGESGLMVVRISGDHIEINCPNLLKYKDEHSRRSGVGKLVTPPIDRDKRIENREKREDVTPQPTNLASFNDWMEKRETDLIPFFEVNYNHLGGVEHLRSVVKEIREAIFLDPNSPKYKWDQHRENGTWGDVVRGWNRTAARQRGVG